jgi:GNAT superfamily N-acetyltransferase
LSVEIVTLDALQAERRIDGLARLLSEVVNGGGGVSFMAPFSSDDAMPFWRGVIVRLAADEIVLLAAMEAEKLIGSVQLHPMWQPNQPHRAEVAKLLVSPAVRRRGIGRALMLRLESEAVARGRTLITLDTEVGSAGEALYRSMGYTAAGVIPDFALRSHGGLVGTTYFYKKLAA